MATEDEFCTEAPTTKDQIDLADDECDGESSKRPKKLVKVDFALFDHQEKDTDLSSQQHEARKKIHDEIRR